MHMTEPKLTITVVTVCLNAAVSIRRTIESVIGQIRKPDEYIIVDGGSTDGTSAIIAEYRPSISKVICEPDSGISDAFNKGITRASGDIIGIINADDWYEPETLQTVAASMNEADVLHGNMQYWRGNQKDYLAVGNHSQLHREMTLHHPTVFVKKRLYDRCGGFRLDYQYAMDYELLLRFVRARSRFVYIPATIANMSFDGRSDVHWREAIRETARAKIDNGYNGFSAHLYCGKQLLRSHVARALRQMGCVILLRKYRKHISVVRKS